MEKVKETKEYKVFKKRSGRFAVKDASNKWVNGDKKFEILKNEGLSKVPTPKQKEEAAEAPQA